MSCSCTYNGRSAQRRTRRNRQPRLNNDQQAISTTPTTPSPLILVNHRQHHTHRTRKNPYTSPNHHHHHHHVAWGQPDYSHNLSIAGPNSVLMQFGPFFIAGSNNRVTIGENYYNFTEQVHGRFPRWRSNVGGASRPTPSTPETSSVYMSSSRSINSISISSSSSNTNRTRTPNPYGPPYVPPHQRRGPGQPGDCTSNVARTLSNVLDHSTPAPSRNNFLGALDNMERRLLVLTAASRNLGAEVPESSLSSPPTAVESRLVPVDADPCPTHDQQRPPPLAYEEEPRPPSPYPSRPAATSSAFRWFGGSFPTLSQQQRQGGASVTEIEENNSSSLQAAISAPPTLLPQDEQQQQQRRPRRANYGARPHRCAEEATSEDDSKTNTNTSFPSSSDEDHSRYSRFSGRRSTRIGPTIASNNGSDDNDSKILKCRQKDLVEQRKNFRRMRALQQGHAGRVSRRTTRRLQPRRHRRADIYFDAKITKSSLAVMTESDPTPTMHGSIPTSVDDSYPHPASPISFEEYLARLETLDLSSPEDLQRFQKLQALVGDTSQRTTISSASSPSPTPLTPAQRKVLNDLLYRPELEANSIMPHNEPWTTFMMTSGSSDGYPSPPPPHQSLSADCARATSAKAKGKRKKDGNDCGDKDRGMDVDRIAALNAKEGYVPWLFPADELISVATPTITTTATTLAASTTTTSAQAPAKKKLSPEEARERERQLQARIDALQNEIHLREDAMAMGLPCSSRDDGADDGEEEKYVVGGGIGSRYEDYAENWYEMEDYGESDDNEEIEEVVVKSKSKAKDKKEKKEVVAPVAELERRIVTPHRCRGVPLSKQSLASLRAMLTRTHQQELGLSETLTQQQAESQAQPQPQPQLTQTQGSARLISLTLVGGQWVSTATGQPVSPATSTSGSEWPSSTGHYGPCPMSTLALAPMPATTAPTSTPAYGGYQQSNYAPAPSTPSNGGRSSQGVKPSFRSAVDPNTGKQSFFVPGGASDPNRLPYPSSAAGPDPLLFGSTRSGSPTPLSAPALVSSRPTTVSFNSTPPPPQGSAGYATTPSPPLPSSTANAPAVTRPAFTLSSTVTSSSMSMIPAFSAAPFSFSGSNCNPFAVPLSTTESETQSTLEAEGAERLLQLSTPSRSTLPTIPPFSTTITTAAPFSFSNLSAIPFLPASSAVNFQSTPAPTPQTAAVITPSSAMKISGADAPRSHLTTSSTTTTTTTTTHRSARYLGSRTQPGADMHRGFQGSKARVAVATLAAESAAGGSARRRGNLRGATTVGWKDDSSSSSEDEEGAGSPRPSAPLPVTSSVPAPALVSAPILNPAPAVSATFISRVLTTSPRPLPPAALPFLPSPTGDDAEMDCIEANSAAGSISVSGCSGAGGAAGSQTGLGGNVGDESNSVSSGVDDGSGTAGAGGDGSSGGAGASSGENSDGNTDDSPPGGNGGNGGSSGDSGNQAGLGLDELAALLDITNIFTDQSGDINPEPVSPTQATGFAAGTGFAVAAVAPSGFLVAAAAVGVSTTAAESSLVAGVAASGVTIAPLGVSATSPVFSTASAGESYGAGDGSGGDGGHFPGTKSGADSDSDNNDSQDPSQQPLSQEADSPTQAASESDDELLGNAMANMNYSSDSEEEGTPDAEELARRAVVEAELLLFLQTGAGGEFTPLSASSQQQPSSSSPPANTPAGQSTCPAFQATTGPIATSSGAMSSRSLASPVFSAESMVAHNYGSPNEGPGTGSEADSEGDSGDDFQLQPQSPPYVPSNPDPNQLSLFPPYINPSLVPLPSSPPHGSLESSGSSSPSTEQSQSQSPSPPPPPPRSSAVLSRQNVQMPPTSGFSTAPGATNAAAGPSTVLAASVTTCTTTTAATSSTSGSALDRQKRKRQGEDIEMGSDDEADEDDVHYSKRLLVTSSSSTSPAAGTGSGSSATGTYVRSVTPALSAVTGTTQGAQDSQRSSMKPLSLGWRIINSRQWSQARGGVPLSKRRLQQAAQQQPPTQTTSQPAAQPPLLIEQQVATETSSAGPPASAMPSFFLPAAHQAGAHSVASTGPPSATISATTSASTFPSFATAAATQAGAQPTALTGPTPGTTSGYTMPSVAMTASTQTTSQPAVTTGASPGATSGYTFPSFATAAANQAGAQPAAGTIQTPAVTSAWSMSTSTTSTASTTPAWMNTSAANWCAPPASSLWNTPMRSTWQGPTSTTSNAPLTAAWNTPATAISTSAVAFPFATAAFGMNNPLAPPGPTPQGLCTAAGTQLAIMGALQPFTSTTGPTTPMFNFQPGTIFPPLTTTSIASSSNRDIDGDVDMDETDSGAGSSASAFASSGFMASGSGFTSGSGFASGARSVSGAGTRPGNKSRQSRHMSSALLNALSNTTIPFPFAQPQPTIAQPPFHIPTTQQAAQPAFHTPATQAAQPTFHIPATQTIQSAFYIPATRAAQPTFHISVTQAAQPTFHIQATPPAPTFAFSSAPAPAVTITPAPNAPFFIMPAADTKTAAPSFLAPLAGMITPVPAIATTTTMIAPATTVPLFTLRAPIATTAPSVIMPAATAKTSPLFLAALAAMTAPATTHNASPPSPVMTTIPIATTTSTISTTATPVITASPVVGSPPVIIPTPVAVNSTPTTSTVSTIVSTTHDQQQRLSAPLSGPILSPLNASSLPRRHRSSPSNNLPYERMSLRYLQQQSNRAKRLSEPSSSSQAGPLLAATSQSPATPTFPVASTLSTPQLPAAPPSAAAPLAPPPPSPSSRPAPITEATPSPPQQPLQLPPASDQQTSADQASITHSRQQRSTQRENARFLEQRQAQLQQEQWDIDASIDTTRELANRTLEERMRRERLFRHAELTGVATDRGIIFGRAEQLYSQVNSLIDRVRTRAEGRLLPPTSLDPATTPEQRPTSGPHPSTPSFLRLSSPSTSSSAQPSPAPSTPSSPGPSSLTRSPQPTHAPLTSASVDPTSSTQAPQPTQPPSASSPASSSSRHQARQPSQAPSGSGSAAFSRPQTPRQSIQAPSVCVSAAESFLPQAQIPLQQIPNPLAATAEDASPSREQSPQQTSSALHPTLAGASSYGQSSQLPFAPMPTIPEVASLRERTPFTPGAPWSLQQANPTAPPTAPTPSASRTSALTSSTSAAAGPSSSQAQAPRRPAQTRSAPFPAASVPAAAASSSTPQVTQRPVRRTLGDITAVTGNVLNISGAQATTQAATTHIPTTQTENTQPPTIRTENAPPTITQLTNTQPAATQPTATQPALPQPAIAQLRPTSTARSRRHGGGPVRGRRQGVATARGYSSIIGNDNPARLDNQLPQSSANFSRAQRPPPARSSPYSEPSSRESLVYSLQVSQTQSPRMYPTRSRTAAAAGSSSQAASSSTASPSSSSRQGPVARAANENYNKNQPEPNLSVSSFAAPTVSPPAPTSPVVGPSTSQLLSSSSSSDPNSTSEAQSVNEIVTHPTLAPLAEVYVALTPRSPHSSTDSSDSEYFSAESNFGSDTEDNADDFLDDQAPSVELTPAPVIEPAVAVAERPQHQTQAQARASNATLSPRRSARIRDRRERPATAPYPSPQRNQPTPAAGTEVPVPPRRSERVRSRNYAAAAAAAPVPPVLGPRAPRAARARALAPAPEPRVPRPTRARQAPPSRAAHPAAAQADVPAQDRRITRSLARELKMNTNSRYKVAKKTALMASKKSR